MTKVVSISITISIENREGEKNRSNTCNSQSKKTDMVSFQIEEI